MCSCEYYFPQVRGAPKGRGPWHVRLLPYRLIRHWIDSWCLSAWAYVCYSGSDYSAGWVMNGRVGSRDQISLRWGLSCGSAVSLGCWTMCMMCRSSPNVSHMCSIGNLEMFYPMKFVWWFVLTWGPRTNSALLPKRQPWAIFFICINPKWIQVAILIIFLLNHFLRISCNTSILGF